MTSFSYNYILIIAGPPSVNAFDFDLNSAVLVLEFSSIVDASTVNGSAITLQSAVTHRPMESQMLTVDGTMTLSPSGRVISLQLGVEDTNEIKRIRSLCTSSRNCYMTVTQFLVLDSAGVGNIPINDGSAVAVRNFTEDLTPPSLLVWTLDMDEGRMELYFSETVDVDMFQIGQFTLRGLTQATTYSLTNSAPPSEPAAAVVIMLSNEDLNEIKRIPDLATNLNDTYLSVGNTAVIDMNGNRMPPISAAEALSALLITIDFTSPELVSFSLNIGSGALTLTFSETVEAASFNFSGISLVNGQVSTVNGELRSNASYRLTGGSWPMFRSAVLEVQLTAQDLTAINAIDILATNENNTYITADSTSIFDVEYNPLVPISLADRLQVSSFHRSSSKSWILYLCTHESY